MCYYTEMLYIILAYCTEIVEMQICRPMFIKIVHYIRGARGVGPTVCDVNVVYYKYLCCMSRSRPSSYGSVGRPRPLCLQPGRIYEFFDGGILGRNSSKGCRVQVGVNFHIGLRPILTSKKTSEGV